MTNTVNNHTINHRNAWGMQPTLSQYPLIIISSRNGHIPEILAQEFGELDIGLTTQAMTIISTSENLKKLKDILSSADPKVFLDNPSQIVNIQFAPSEQDIGKPVHCFAIDNMNISPEPAGKNGRKDAWLGMLAIIADKAVDMPTIPRNLEGNELQIKKFLAAKSIYKRAVANGQISNELAEHVITTTRQTKHKIRELDPEKGSNYQVLKHLRRLVSQYEKGSR